jgi:hypothetical protein
MAELFLVEKNLMYNIKTGMSVDMGIMASSSSAGILSLLRRSFRVE